MTPETLRAAMRDPRYRSDAHPESAAFRGWVREGWQAFVAGGEGRTGVVQVRACTRTRNGQPEQVGAHTRGGAAGEDITGVAAMPVSAAAGTEPPQPRPGITAASPTLVIFVGGAGDSKNRNVLSFLDEEPLPTRFGHRVPVYHPHDDHDGIIGRIATAPPSTRIVLIGHSWGGHRAAAVAAELGQTGRPVDTLITVDPVGWQADDEFLRRARVGAREWVNIRAVPRRANLSDAVAVVGGAYANAPSRHATRHIEANQVHSAFGALLRSQDADGVSGFDRMLGR